MVDPANLAIMDLEARAGHRRRFRIPYGRWRRRRLGHVAQWVAQGGESTLHRPDFERPNG